MVLTTTAISSLLLSLGLATCGWRFFSAYRKNVSTTTEGSIGKLLTSLFFLTATYNGILGAAPLLFSDNPQSALWAVAASHAILTLLAILSVYAVYYIFWPETSPHALMGAITLTGSIGFFHINTPLQLAPLVMIQGGQGLTVITSSLLLINMSAILYLFISLFQKTTTRSIKILSLSICCLVIASTVNASLQLLPSHWISSSHWFALIEIAVGVAGLIFFVTIISAESKYVFEMGADPTLVTKPARRKNLPSELIARHATKGVIALFLVFFLWWAILYFKFHGNTAPISYNVWTDLYILIILWGVWFGFRLSQKNGGLRNTFGTAVAYFTIGLYLQAVAGAIYGFYVNWLGIPTPYPSIADVGWIGSVVFYSVGSIFLVKYSSAVNVLGLQKSAVHLSVLAGIIFSTSWISLLSAGYSVSDQGLLVFLIDLAFVTAGSIYLSVAILALRGTVKSKNVAMSQYCKLTVAALTIHFVTDFNFIYRNVKGTWVDGDYGDLLLLTSYAVMAYVLSREVVHTNGKILRKNKPAWGATRPNTCSYPIYQKALNLLSIIKKQGLLTPRPYRASINNHEALGEKRSGEL